MTEYFTGILPVAVQASLTSATFIEPIRVLFSNLLNTWWDIMPVFIVAWLWFYVLDKAVDYVKSAPSRIWNKTNAIPKMQRFWDKFYWIPAHKLYLMEQNSLLREKNTLVSKQLKIMKANNQSKFLVSEVLDNIGWKIDSLWNTHFKVKKWGWDDWYYKRVDDVLRNGWKLSEADKARHKRENPGDYGH